MAKQDEWKRITLRIPPDLHARVAAAAESVSLNGLIVEVLEDAFPPSPEPLISILEEMSDINERLSQSDVAASERAELRKRYRVLNHELGQHFDVSFGRHD